MLMITEEGMSILFLKSPAKVQVEKFVHLDLIYDAIVSFKKRGDAIFEWWPQRRHTRYLWNNNSSVH